MVMDHNEQEDKESENRVDRLTVEQQEDIAKKLAEMIAKFVDEINNGPDKEGNKLEI